MRKYLIFLVAVLAAALTLAPAAGAQAPTAQEVVQAYYEALGKAAASGDLTALANLFADDATVSVPAISPKPVQGKAMMQAVFGGILNLLKGASIKVDDLAVEGEKVTVRYRLVAAAAQTEVKATDTFTIKDGKIQSLTIEVAAETLPKSLPVTGAAAGNLALGLLTLAGLASLALGRRWAR